MATELADAVLILHFIYVLAVLIPVPLILLGWKARWRFIRNDAFRSIHLLMISLVAFESIAGVICPLTSLEDFLRNQAGQAGYRGSFVAHWLGRVLYYDWKPVTFLVIYLSFATLVAALYLLIPPRWLLKRRARL